MLRAFVDHPVSTEASIRLNKYISDSGYCSRREADKLIDSHRVKVNGKRPVLGTRVAAGDVVTVDGQEILGSPTSKSDRIYIAYNKPVGITCTTERSIKGNIIDAIDHDQRIFPIGRLDKPSEGLILLTSDGDIVNKILRAENVHEKEYLVTVNSSIGADFVNKMSAGLPILGTMTKPCRVSIVARATFKITLTQGLNRQIRRMCEYLGYEVVQLSRLRIMTVTLGKLKPGQWRNLNVQEVEQLNAAIASSTSEPGADQGRRAKRRVQQPLSEPAVDRALSVSKSAKSTGQSRNSPSGQNGWRGTRQPLGNKPSEAPDKTAANAKPRTRKIAGSGAAQKMTALKRAAARSAAPRHKDKPSSGKNGKAGIVKDGGRIDGRAAGRAGRSKEGKPDVSKNNRKPNKTTKPNRAASNKPRSSGSTRRRK